MNLNARYIENMSSGHQGVKAKKADAGVHRDQDVVETVSKQLVVRDNRVRPRTETERHSK